MIMATKKVNLYPFRESKLDNNMKFSLVLLKIEELEKYSEDTISTLLYTTLQAGGNTSTAADHAASHIGKASGLLLLLKSLPYHASRSNQFIHIPADVAEKHGLLVKHGGQSEIRMDSRSDLCDAVFDMASVAHAHLLKARELAGSVPAEACPVLLPAVPAQVFLDSLRRVNFDVYDSSLTRGVLTPPLWFQLKLKYGKGSTRSLFVVLYSSDRRIIILTESEIKESLFHCAVSHLK